MSSSASWASSAGVRASMQSNRGRDTRPELAVRRACHALGLRYRVSVRPLPDLRRTADLVFTRRRVAVFVDGCFWHGCPDHHTVAKTNAGFWTEKVRGNVARDRDTNARLRAADWRIVRAWEHEVPEVVAHRVRDVVLAEGVRDLRAPTSRHPPRPFERDATAEVPSMCTAPAVEIPRRSRRSPGVPGGPLSREVP